LVEMLIVIVIIGILAAALIPRLTSIQWSARDAARKAHLNQLWSALLQYQSNFWELPPFSWWAATSMKADLNEIMTDIPRDPDRNRSRVWIWNSACLTVTGWNYWYVPVTKNWIPWSAFVLMAATETDWWNSNRVYEAAMASSWMVWWCIVNNTDYDGVANLKCQQVRFWSTNDLVNCRSIKSQWTTRYIYIP
jgi:type II secretory pathway pseudopilin PulG